jgi:hypothetical protein
VLLGLRKDFVEADGGAGVVYGRTFKGVELVLGHESGVPELRTER